jgi:hypothetical protein
MKRKVMDVCVPLLPSDIWLIIWDYSTQTPDDMFIALKVCKRWRVLIKKYLLPHRTIDITVESFIINLLRNDLLYNVKIPTYHPIPHYHYAILWHEGGDLLNVGGLDNEYLKKILGEDHQTKWSMKQMTKELRKSRRIAADMYACGDYKMMRPPLKTLLDDIPQEMYLWSGTPTIPRLPLIVMEVKHVTLKLLAPDNPMRWFFDLNGGAPWQQALFEANKHGITLESLVNFLDNFEWRHNLFLYRLYNQKASHYNLPKDVICIIMEYNMRNSREAINMMTVCNDWCNHMVDVVTKKLMKPNVGDFLFDMLRMKYIDSLRFPVDVNGLKLSVNASDRCEPFVVNIIHNSREPIDLCLACNGSTWTTEVYTIRHTNTTWYEARGSLYDLKDVLPNLLACIPHPKLVEQHVGKPCIATGRVIGPNYSLVEATIGDIQHLHSKHPIKMMLSKVWIKVESESHPVAMIDMFTLRKLVENYEFRQAIYFQTLDDKELRDIPQMPDDIWNVILDIATQEPVHMIKVMKICKTWRSLADKLLLKRKVDVTLDSVLIDMMDCGYVTHIRLPNDLNSEKINIYKQGDKVEVLHDKKMMSIFSGEHWKMATSMVPTGPRYRATGTIQTLRGVLSWLLSRMPPKDAAMKQKEDDEAQGWSYISVHFSEIEISVAPWKVASLHMKHPIRKDLLLWREHHVVPWQFGANKEDINDYVTSFQFRHELYLMKMQQADVKPAPIPKLPTDLWYGILDYATLEPIDMVNALKVCKEWNSVCSLILPERRKKNLLNPFLCYLLEYRYIDYLYFPTDRSGIKSYVTRSDDMARIALTENVDVTYYEEDKWEVEMEDTSQPFHFIRGPWASLRILLPRLFLFSPLTDSEDMLMENSSNIPMSHIEIIPNWDKIRSLRRKHPIRVLFNFMKNRKLWTQNLTDYSHHATSRDNLREYVESFDFCHALYLEEMRDAAPKKTMPREMICSILDYATQTPQETLKLMNVCMDWRCIIKEELIPKREVAHTTWLSDFLCDILRYEFANYIKIRCHNEIISIVVLPGGDTIGIIGEYRHLERSTINGWSNSSKLGHKTSMGCIATLRTEMDILLEGTKYSDTPKRASMVVWFSERYYDLSSQHPVRWAFTTANARVMFGESDKGSVYLSDLNEVIKGSGFKHQLYLLELYGNTL